jgi:hypothetical protein
MYVGQYEESGFFLCNSGQFGSKLNITTGFENLFCAIIYLCPCLLPSAQDAQGNLPDFFGREEIEEEERID